MRCERCGRPDCSKDDSFLEELRGPASTFAGGAIGTGVNLSAVQIARILGACLIGAIVYPFRFLFDSEGGEP